MGEIGGKIAKINDVLNGFIWGPVMLGAFLFVGILFTLRCGFFQVRYIKLWMNHTICSMFRSKNVRKTQDKHAISQFQSICTALASTFGTGNIAGVATAITTGGPGAVFWMWVSAFFGMMTGFAEKTLGIRYRYRNAEGNWVGGAFVYIERGMHCKMLAVLFAVFCVFASFGIGNMTQVNSIACGLESAFQVPPVVTAVFVMIFVALVMVGGIKRIAAVTEKLVPFMAIAFMGAGGIVLFANAGNIPEAFGSIVSEAFSIKAAGGGVLGYGMATAMKRGISRGVFSNEAGLGSSVFAHCASDVKEPVEQGMWGVFEVFADTLVVCTMTALVILTSGVYQTDQALAQINTGQEVLSGTALTGAAFDTVIPFGSQIVSIAVMMFALATLVGWSYYGERAAVYLVGEKGIFPYKLVYILMILVGCVTSLNLVWDISDTLNGFMAIPNLIALFFLRHEVVAMQKDYLKRKGIK